MGKVRRPDRFKTARDFGNARERVIGSRGYKHTPGSGSSGVKGDLRRGDFMVEVKATRADSFRLTADIMGKLRNDGLTNGRPGVVIVELGDGTRLAVLEATTFERLVEPDE